MSPEPMTRTFARVALSVVPISPMAVFTDSGPRPSDDPGTTTVSPGLPHLPPKPRWAAGVPVGRLLVSPADAQRHRLVVRPAGDLQRQRQAAGGKAARHGKRA